MKNDLDAEIPLSPAALAMLRELKEDAFSAYVFPGRKIGQPISSDTMLAFLKRGKAKRPDCTVHGFRTSFRSWGDDISEHSRETLEFCLHHIEGGEAERAYRQSTMLGDVISACRRRITARDARSVIRGENDAIDPKAAACDARTAARAHATDRPAYGRATPQYFACPGVRGNGIASRTLESPVT